MRRLVDGGLADARRILGEKIDDLHTLAKALLEFETLSGEEITGVLKGLKPVREETEPKLATPALAVDNPDAAVAMKELSSALWRLSAQAREALILVGASGFSYEEASRLCGCTVGTLKVRVSRARKELAKQLA